MTDVLLSVNDEWGTIYTITYFTLNRKKINSNSTRNFTNRHCGDFSDF